MAVDEFLLSRAEEEGRSPVLRLYSFDPPAITLGYHQDPEKVLDLDSVRDDGIDLVRRITGGRALLHDGELTYSVCASLDSPFFGQGLQKTFIDISMSLVDALRKLGVDAAISDGKKYGGRTESSSPCLVSSSRHEITASGKKLVGSAQRRTARAFIQHGSILLRPASERIAAYLKGDWSSLSDMVTSLRTEMGDDPSVEDLKEALIDSFGKRFDASFDRLVLDQGDRDRIDAAAAGKISEFAILTGREPSGR